MSDSEGPLKRNISTTSSKITSKREFLNSFFINAVAQDLLRMNQEADLQLSNIAPAETAYDICADCDYEIPCFHGGKNLNERIAKQQELNAQQAFINNRSPEEMEARLNEADQRKNETGTYRTEHDSTIRAMLRDNYEREFYQKTLKEEKLKKTQTEAEQHAHLITQKEMKKVDAAHALDLIVGGRTEDADKIEMRPRGANRSIGSGWRQKGRREALIKIVKKYITARKKLMNIVLKLCDD